jgi:hypothetical protein
VVRLMSANPSPYDVIHAALLQPAPPGSTPAEQAAFHARLAEAALAEHDLLARPPSHTDTGDVERAARFLAQESDSPRYDGLDVWQMLLDPDMPNNVHHAHATAVRAHPGGGRDYERDLAQARDLIVRYLAARRAAGTEG